MGQLGELEDLAAFMRKTGATRARTADGIELELGPEPKPLPPPVKEDPPEPEPVCPCGHPHDHHSDVGCLEGCSLGRCGGSGQHPEPEEGTP